MSDQTIVQRAKAILYGHGVGEHPAIIRSAADADETVTAPTVAFDLYAGQGAKVAAGDTLSIYSAATAADAHALYVLSVSTDALVAVNGYWGSPVVVADDLDGALFELNPLRAEHFLFQAVETVFSSLLYPEVSKYFARSVTPDLATYQVDIPATVKQILSAWQVIADQNITIPWELDDNLESTLSSTGTMGTFYAVDGSDVYYTTVEKYATADTISEALTQCIATGAAAIALGASVSETNLESSAKDSQSRRERNPAQDLWREFVTLRSSISEEISRDVDWFEYRR